MQVESIEIKNYRLFRNVELNNLRPMTVVVGANGSGKSTLFDVFTFLKDALAENGSRGGRAGAAVLANWSVATR